MLVMTSKHEEWRGPAGLMMGLAVAGLGIATAIHKAAETQPQVKLCTRCDGYGVECCDVCGGKGQISWEGKAHRTNPCPRCFGARLKKCPRCDGWRVKKDSTPVLQKLKEQPKKK
jgi:DnaJ-class molecular chaperone